MLVLLIGLAGFLGLHCVRIVAPAWREARIARMGEGAWKGLYSVASLVFFVLMVWGYGLARQHPVLVWVTPMGLRHLGMALVAVAFVLLAAAYVPDNAIKARLRHPMILGVKLWAFAHLLMSGWLHSMVVFGAFLVWAIADFASARRRAVQPAVGKSSAAMTVLTVVGGLVFCAVFALWLHRWLIGIAPFPGG